MEEQPKTKKKFSLPVLIRVIKNTIKGFSEDNVTTLSASLAYATLFSIVPLLTLFIALGTYLHEDIISELFFELRPILGMDVVDKVKSIIDNADTKYASSVAGIVSLGITVFGATAIFAEIQGALNKIWRIKPIPKKSWLKFIRTRVLSFSIIIIFAFILLVTFSLTNAITHLTDRIMADYPDFASSIVKVTGMVLNVIVTTMVFTLLYKVLPDAKIKSKDVVVGAFITTCLFLLGQWAISLYIGIAHVGSAYGTAAFMIVIITWIYYSAMIIYIGAEFTESWANEMGGSIFPAEFAVTTKEVEIHQKVPVKLKK